MDTKYLNVVVAVIESALIANFIIKSLEPAKLRKMNWLLYVMLIINLFILTVMGIFLDKRIMEIINQKNAIWIFAVLMSKMFYFLITSLLLFFRKKMTDQIALREGGAILLIFFVTLFIGLSILEIKNFRI